MESQLQHTHGRHYDDADALTGAPHTGEDEHHGEKKSVMKKVKEKAKKIKNTITKHGHGDGGHHHDDVDEEVDDDETVQDPEVHGAPMYDSARVGQLGLDANLPQPRGNLERPSVIAEDRYTEPVASRGVPPPVSTGAYGTNLSEPSSGLGHNGAYSPEKWRGKIGQPTGMEEEEEPFAPNPTRMGTPIGVTDPTYGLGLVPDPVVNLGRGQDMNRGGLKDVIGKETRMVPDPHAPKDPSNLGSDPSNYATKVSNPTHTGGKEADLSHLQHSFDKMGIDSGPKTFDPNHPGNLPRETLTGNPSSQTSSYADKISSSASAIADKAVAAKDVIASKRGYSGQNPTTHESVNNPGSVTDYAHTITDKVTGTLAPVYEKVVDAGSSVMSKVQGSVSGTGKPQVHEGSDKVTDKGVSVKENLMETLRPGEGDKALSDAITHALHRGNQEEPGRKSGEEKPMGTVTESVEVRRRLGTDRHRDSSDVVADKGVAERLSDAMGSWFGGKGDAPQGTVGTSYVTDEGLSSNPTGGTGDRNRGSGKER